MSFETKIYMDDGGDTQVVADGGNLNVEPGGKIILSGVAIIATGGKINALENLIGDDGDIELVDTVWDDLRVPALSTKTGGSKIPGTTKIADNGSGSQGILSYVFDDTIEEELYFAVQIPHKWKQGTTIAPHVHWVPTVNGGVGEVVSWGLEYSLAEIGGVFPESTIIYGNANTPDGDLVANTHYLTEIGNGISMVDVDSVSPMLICRIFRDATGAGLADDYTADAALLEIDFHFEIDSMGSGTEYIK